MPLIMTPQEAERLPQGHREHLGMAQNFVDQSPFDRLPLPEDFFRNPKNPTGLALFVYRVLTEENLQDFYRVSGPKLIEVRKALARRSSSFVAVGEQTRSFLQSIDGFIDYVRLHWLDRKTRRYNNRGELIDGQVPAETFLHAQRGYPLEGIAGELKDLHLR